MIVQDIVEEAEGNIVIVQMSTAEARVLHDALTAAKIAIGPDLLIGRVGQEAGVDVEQMRGVLATMLSRYEFS